MKMQSYPYLLQTRTVKPLILHLRETFHASLPDSLVLLVKAVIKIHESKFAVLNLFANFHSLHFFVGPVLILANLFDRKKSAKFRAFAVYERPKMDSDYFKY